MKCPNCMRELTPGADRCAACGRMVADAFDPGAPDFVPADNSWADIPGGPGAGGDAEPAPAAADTPQATTDDGAEWTAHHDLDHLNVGERRMLDRALHNMPGAFPEELLDDPNTDITVRHGRKLGRHVTAISMMRVVNEDGTSSNESAEELLRRMRTHVDGQVQGASRPAVGQDGTHADPLDELPPAEAIQLLMHGSQSSQSSVPAGPVVRLLAFALGLGVALLLVVAVATQR